jgi:hypothetical protein
MTMRTIRVILADNTSYVTGINGTDEEIKAYFVGQWLNVGNTDDLLKLCVAVEFLA